MRVLTFLLLSIYSCTQLWAQPQKEYPKDYFRSPLDVPLVLAGTFGELRTNHFHSGIDIKTQQREGLKVYAVAEGVVSRIKVGVYGFGKALYVRHPNGYTTVYAHLSRFSDEIEAYIRQEQYRKKSYEVEIFPPASAFPFKKGDVIAYSGNSGGSGGPHLHFEVRDTRTENIINPLLFGFDVKDNRAPQVFGVYAYDFDEEDELLGSEHYRVINTANGRYALAGDGIVEVQQRPGFGVVTIDRLDGATNKNGPYSIKCFVGDQIYYHFEMETFAFHETRYINSHIDFGQKVCCGTRVNKMFLDPGNNLSTYRATPRMNLPALVKDSIYNARIEIADLGGNTTVVDFKVKSKGSLLENPAEPGNLPVFKYNQSNSFKNEQVQIELSSGSLYRDILFEYRTEPSFAGLYSPVHYLAAEEIGVQRYYTLKIKPENFEGIPSSKLAIASIKNNKIVDYEGSGYANGFVSCRTRQFGGFAVVADTNSPLVSFVNFRDGDVVRKSELQIRISDDFSGIDSYNVYVDGQWVRAEYDYKADMLRVQKSDLDFEAGAHQFKVVVADALNNRTERKVELIWP